MIPTLVSRRLADGLDPDEAFRHTVARFEGSVAIAASSAGARPDQLHLAPARQRPVPLRRAGRGRLRRGQRALRAGRGDRRLPADGRRGHPAARSSCSTGRGPEHSGRLRPHALRRRPSCPCERGTRARPRSRPGTSTGPAFPHFLLKEIYRGAHVVPQDPAGQDHGRRAQRARCVRPRRRRPAARPAPSGCVSRGHRAGSWSSVRARPRSPARASPPPWPGAPGRTCPTVVSGLLATELSGFGLADDMSDTLVIAISQSGTTTDTNRTVDLVRARGAARHRRRQPAQQRPGRASPTACSTPPTGGTSR